MPKPSPPARTTFAGAFDRTTAFFAALAVVSAFLVFLVKGAPALERALDTSATLLITIGPLIAVGLFLGGLAKEIADPKRIAPLLGRESGLRGLVLATGLGAITPGGPFASFPIVYALFATGADIGAVVAYVTGWSLIALHRVIVWELPLLGFDFTATRLVASLPLPILAGVLARAIVRAGIDVPPPAASAGAPVSGARA